MKVKMLHFTGEGHGFFSGVTEYFVAVAPDSTEHSDADQCSPGFTLHCVSEALVPECFPFEETIVQKG